jgi:hypothetical protein
MVNTFEIAGHVPVCSCALRLLQERTKLDLDESGVLNEMSHVECGPPQSRFRGKRGEVLQIVH